MALDLIPRRMLSFPSFNLPDFWDEGDDWISRSSALDHSGLSVSEDDKKVYIEAAVPGIDPKDVEITYQDGYLWVRGETKKEEKDKSKKYYKSAASAFSYRVAVPGEIDQNKEPEASYKHGVMTITFDKAPKAQPKKIQIKSLKS